MTQPAFPGFPGSNTIVIGGDPAPGKWTLTEAPKVYGWDIRKGFGLSGATVVPIGDELVEATFLVELWDEDDTDHYADFKAYRKKYLRKGVVKTPGGITTKALGLQHPELNDMEVTQVVVKKITPLVNDGYGLWTCTVTFLQYRKPVIAPPKPLAAIPAAAAPKPTAQDALDRELEQLRNEHQRLSDPLVPHP
jgi:hypothetical protein